MRVRGSACCSSPRAEAGEYDGDCEARSTGPATLHGSCPPEARIGTRLFVQRTQAEHRPSCQTKRALCATYYRRIRPTPRRAADNLFHIGTHFAFPRRAASRKAARVRPPTTPPCPAAAMAPWRPSGRGPSRAEASAQRRSSSPVASARAWPVTTGHPKLANVPCLFKGLQRLCRITAAL
jgi:hypothetical protein